MRQFPPSTSALDWQPDEIASYFARHQIALWPLLHEPRQLPDQWLNLLDEPKFADFLIRQRLHVLWLALFEARPDWPIATEISTRLRTSARASTARELPQQRVLEALHEEFASRQIPYFVAKGAHLRHVYYEQPSLRPAVDIDVFVPPTHRDAAIHFLRALGFEARPLASTLSHELKLTLRNGDVDLHWHLFRPGRARTGLLAWLFGHRERFGKFWGLDATASLLIMLVHPAITKYLVSPTSMLIHQVDQALLIRSGKVDWEQLAAALARFGVRSAAWSSLYLLRRLSGIESPEGIADRLRPGAVHARYLRQWIDRGWISRSFDRRWMVAALFSLALQDNWLDRARALRALTVTRKSSELILSD